MHKVISVLPQEDYKMLVAFENGEQRIYNAAPLLCKPVFMPLKDISVFNKVYIEYGAVTWKDQGGNEIDICPDKMYMDSIPVDWDPDFTKVTPAERKRIEEAENSGFVSDSEIDWDNIGA